MPSKVPASSAFGKRLTDLRLARGLTQTQLAELIGSSQRAISHYETVADFPPPGVIIELARALKITTDELLGLRTIKSAPLADALDPESKRLWRQLKQVMALPEKDRRAVVRLINSLVAGRTSGHGAAAHR
ncbi:MAG TPA: helix-turn-helix transcriptional regulator [Polyangiaceae bacterium]|nr:helix-turn-helix transcriptional regulator [Polyangiaceae bacterium]